MNKQEISLRLRDTDPEIRKEARTALKHLKPKEALDILIEVLGSENREEVLLEINQAIREIGRKDLEFFLEKLKHAPSEIRKHIIKILRDIGDSSITPFLVNLLKEEPEIRAAAIEILGYLKDAWSLDYIRNLIFDPSKPVQIATVKALGYFEDKESVDRILTLLNNPDKELKLTTIETLAMIKDPRVGDYLWDIGLNDPDETVRQKALWALKIIGRAYLKNYEKYLSSEEELSNAIFWELIRHGKAIFWAILDYTHHLDSTVRTRATQILGELREPLAFSRLCELVQDSEKEIRRLAIIGLGKLKTPRAIKFLISELSNPDSFIADAAYEALIDIGKDAVSYLLEEFALANLGVQMKITEIIVKIGPVEAIPLIKEKLSDPQAWIRRVICGALENFHHPEIANLLVEKCLFDPDTLVRAAAVRALGKLKFHFTIDPILSALQDDEETVRLEAIRAIGELNERSLGTHLIPFLTKGSDEEKLTALSVVEKLNCFDAIPILKIMARGWPFGKESGIVRNKAKGVLKHLEEELWRSRP
jgi:HEAT repeat protein